MEAVLEAFAARPEHKSSDSTFLVLMSHGILAGICGTTHRAENPDVLPYDTIFRMFNNCHCLSLKDKPKVIIVQACRGGEFCKFLNCLLRTVVYVFIIGETMLVPIQCK